jgi:hypothetical protein
LRHRDLFSLCAAVGIVTMLVFAGDLATPLGVAIWILYVVPLALTLFSRNPLTPVIAAFAFTMLMVVTLFSDTPGIARWVVYVNRSCGTAVIWSIAFLARNLIETRGRVEREEWIRATQARLLQSLQGELSQQEIGARVLGVIGPAAGAPVSAIYASDGSDLQLIASQGLR